MVSLTFQFHINTHSPSLDAAPISDYISFCHELLTAKTACLKRPSVNAFMRHLQFLHQKKMGKLWTLGPHRHTPNWLLLLLATCINLTYDDDDDCFGLWSSHAR